MQATRSMKEKKHVRWAPKEEEPAPKETARLTAAAVAAASKAAAAAAPSSQSSVVTEEHDDDDDDKSCSASARTSNSNDTKVRSVSSEEDAEGKDSNDVTPDPLAEIEKATFRDTRPPEEHVENEGGEKPPRKGPTNVAYFCGNWGNVKRTRL